MKRLLLSLVTALVLILSTVLPALAATTADVTVTATPSYVAITNSPSSFDFGTVSASSTTNTTTGYFTVTNNSTVVTNVTIGVTATTWAGGVTWAHSETATAGSDTAGLKASKNNGNYDVIVRNGTPLNIATSQAATTNFQWELKLFAPTVFTDSVQKSITVRLTATAT